MKAGKMLRSGREHNVPYSLSRWTDVCGSRNKWDWFKGVLAEGSMFAFDPRTALPSEWSLKPEDTLGLNFWTKDPSNLLADRELLRPYKVKIHMTITGWEEVEKGVPPTFEAIDLYRRAADAFGPENIVWRFSPVPMVDDVIWRFWTIASKLMTPKVYLAFLQENDLMPEKRSRQERRRLTCEFASKAAVLGTKVLLCNDDAALFEIPAPFIGDAAPELGVCAGPEDWGGVPPAEGCGCAIMIDPFSINESCTFGCQYCYAADKNLLPKKINTTRSLPVVP